MREALLGLSFDQRRALELAYYEGLTQTEIARQMQISQMQVSRLLRRTLRVLRENLVPEGAD